MTYIITPSGVRGLRPGESLNGKTIARGINTRRAVSTPVAQTPASVLNEQPSLSEIQKNAGAAGATIPIVYGHAQVGGKVFALDYTAGTWTVGYVVALGEIDSYVNLWVNGEAPATGVTVNYYTGTTSQTADPLLAAAISGYADTLVINRDGLTVGIAYVVLQYTNSQYDNWPRVVAEVQGRKVYNPKTDTTAYSANPALHLGDLLASSVYGHGYTVDATALEAAQDYCDDTTPGEARRQSFLVIDTPQDTDQWVDVLRTYAGCFVARRGSTVYLVPDKAGSSVRTFTSDDVVRDSLTITKQDSSNLPTVVRVEYTDKTGNEWRQRTSAPAEADGVAGGVTPRRESVINLVGIDRHSQAYREAVERLNKLSLSDLQVTFQTFDEALALEVGDIITLTHPYGLTDKLLRLDRDPEQVEPGRWRISAVEYDPAAYSDEVADAPTFADGNLASDAAPAPPTNLVLTETTYQTKNGEYLTRLNIAFTATTDIFATGYSVTVKDQTQAVVYSTTTTQTALATPPLQELVQYTVEVFSYSPTLQGETPLTGVHTIIGKTAIPLPPLTVNGFEAGGEVRLSWSASTDVDAKRYEIRYGDTTGTWDTAKVLDQVDSLRLITRDVPPSESQTGGVWRFYVKTIDSVFQYSDTATAIDIRVTVDDRAFNAGELAVIDTHESLTLVTQHDEVRGGGSVYYADSSETWSTLFGSAAMSTFTDPLAQYQTLGGTAIFYSEEMTLDQDRSGTFIAQAPKAVLFGTDGRWSIGTKPNAGSYTFADGEMAANVTARYAKLRFQDTEPFKIKLPGGYIRADVLTIQEAGGGTSASSGATTVTLDKRFSSIRSIVVTPEGTASRSAVFDNVVTGALTEFDVHIFDKDGTQVAADFQYLVTGLAYGDPYGVFILNTGLWDDNGVWQDGASWKD